MAIALKEIASAAKSPELVEADKNIRERLLSRGELLNVAIGEEGLADLAAIALQSTSKPIAASDAKLGIEQQKGAADAVRYRLAVTNLFVEKAQYYLEDRATQYLKSGKRLFGWALCILIIGSVISVAKLLEFLIAPKTPDGWIDFTFRFTVAFTAYGFLVLLAVTLGKGTKACFDQRERLLTKRHSLRQGRLFLHLNAGITSAEEMKHAFEWNNAQTNAFTDLNADAKAPWGNAVQEMIKIIPELVKTSLAAAEKPGARRESEPK